MGIDRDKRQRYTRKDRRGRDRRGWDRILGIGDDYVDSSSSQLTAQNEKVFCPILSCALKHEIKPDQ